jgi:phosphoglycerol transferase MdoB-like AlkP superfamily enzyme
MSTANRTAPRKAVRQLAARVLLVVALVGAALAISRLASVVLVAFAALLGAIALRAAAEPLARLMLAGVLDFVPLLGPVVAALPGLLLALGESHTTALYALAVYVIVQQLEGNVALPYLQRWSVSLPPAVTLLSIVTGGLIFGVAGILVATPAAVAIIALVKVLYIESGFRDDATAS